MLMRSAAAAAAAARTAATTSVRAAVAAKPSVRHKTALGYEFAGKRAVVTGAGKGIGYGMAVSLANAGADVIAVSRTKADLDALTAECGDRIIPVLVDVGDTDLVKEKLSAVGDIDMVVNNAGIANLEPFMEVTSDAFEQVINVNVKAIISVSQVAAKSMMDRGVSGSIVNVSSQASAVALAEHTSYCVSKGGVDQLTRMMALELGPKKIRTNAVNPTVVLTALGRAAWADPVKADPMLSRIPIGHFAEIKDVVDPIMFLLSDQSEMINGATIPIDGGFWAV